ncbi:restriction endonuclease subunit S [Aromatoleum diolicum]|nr:restriction endonuclease subunit S [Aromatoleum diolicum]
MPRTPAPVGWRWTRLTEIARLESGHTPSRKHPEYWGGQVPWIGIQDARRNNGKRIQETHETTNDIGIANSSARVLPANTVCLTRTASVGYVLVMGRPMATSQDFLNWVCSSELDPDFLKYLFIAEGKEILRFASGSVHQTIYFPEAKAFHISHPLLPEQQRIVAILDEAFDGIAAARANAEQNLRNARALFESHLQAVFSQRGEGWEERRLGDVVSRLTNGYVGPTRNIYQDSGIPYLLARHVKNNRLFFDGKTFITNEFNQKNKKSILKFNDVLLVQSGHIGHSAVVTKEHDGHNCHAMIVITSAEGAFIGPYLSLFFSSSGMQQKFQEIRSGSTVPHLTCGEVKELLVPLPDLATQQRVVDRSQELGTETQRLESLYQRKLDALDELKKSLLHQAFAGQL